MVDSKNGDFHDDARYLNISLLPKRIVSLVTNRPSETKMEHGHRTRDEKLEVKKTTCYMCACRCGIRVHLRDGEVRYIDGNPEHPLNQGVICAKGASGIMKQYSPAGLTQPLMREANRSVD